MIHLRSSLASLARLSDPLNRKLKQKSENAVAIAERAKRAERFHCCLLPGLRIIAFKKDCFIGAIDLPLQRQVTASSFLEFSSWTPKEFDRRFARKKNIIFIYQLPKPLETLIVRPGAIRDEPAGNRHLWSIFGRETTMDTSEFFNTVVKRNYQEFSWNTDDFRSLWNAIISMNTVPEYMALDQHGYAQLSREKLAHTANQIRDKDQSLIDLKLAPANYQTPAQYRTTARYLLPILRR